MTQIPMTRLNPRAVFVFGGLTLIAIGAVAAWWWSGSPGGGADPNNPEQVELGKSVYAANCASCHGVRLEGQPDWRRRKPDGRLPAPPHDETGHTWHHADDQLFSMTKNGMKPPLAPEGYESDMPAFDDALSDEEIWAALAFIKSTWPIMARKTQNRINRASDQ